MPAPTPTTPTTPTSGTTTNESVQTLEIRRDVLVGASVEITFDAVLEEIGPGSVLPDGKPFPMKIEPWPGGRWLRDLGDTGGYKHGHLWGHVQVIKAPTLLELSGPMMMSYPGVNHVQYRLTPESTGTRLAIVHRAMGLIPKEHSDGFPLGWQHGLSRMKELAERRAQR